MNKDLRSIVGIALVVMTGIDWLRSRRTDSDGRQRALRSAELLVAFVENPGIALTRTQLLESVWGYDFAGETRTVDVHVQHLRSKLNGALVQIETLRGVGYKLVETPT